MRTWQNVVVGVDGSKGSEHALAWATEAAHEHQAKLTVITVWSVPAMPVAPGYASLPWYGESDLSDVAEHQLSTTIAAVLGPEPDLPVDRLVVQGHPAHKLVEASAGADLLVVGSRGHGGFTGMLLGSVSQHVTAHAHCPVVVIR